MNIAITSKDGINVTEFNSPILLINTIDNSKKELNYLEVVKYADILVTSHLDGFEAENVTESGVTPVRFYGTIEKAIKELKDCGITRNLPYGENNSGCGGSCGI